MVAGTGIYLCNRRHTSMSTDALLVDGIYRSHG